MKTKKILIAVLLFAVTAIAITSVMIAVTGRNKDTESGFFEKKETVFADGQIPDITPARSNESPKEEATPEPDIDVRKMTRNQLPYAVNGAVEYGEKNAENE